MKVPWIRPLSPLFTPDHRGNNSPNPERYNHQWAKYSAKNFRGYPCDHPGCILQAACTDHMIRVNEGGSMWDRRNHQVLCKKHHDRKSSAEGKGFIMPFVETENGRIPQSRAHLPVDLVRVSGVKRRIKTK